MIFKSFLRSLSAINTKLEDYKYLILLLFIGILTVYESVRISNKYTIKDWLSGPSGFVMLIGCAILCLALIEAIAIINVRRNRLQAVSLQPSVAATLDASPDVMSGESTEFPNGYSDPDKSRNMNNLVLSYLLLIIYVITIKPLGFTVSTALYMTLNLLLLKNSWLITIATVAVLIICTMYGAPAMGLSLPRGMFGF